MPPILTKEEQSTLIQKAISAKSSAYCIPRPSIHPTKANTDLRKGPYSNFRVGATLLLYNQNPSSDGERGGGDYISGANIENVSFPVGTCAERVAFGNAVFSSHTSTTASTAGDKEGGGRVKVKAVAVASDKSPGVSPCGMCRQLYVFSPHFFFL